MRIVICVCLSLWITTVHSGSSALGKHLRFDLPTDVNTIGEAATFFLEPHGYELKLRPPAPREAVGIAFSPIARMMPNGRVMSLIDALLVIAPDDCAVVIDTNNKLVSFEFYPRPAQ